MSNFYIFIAFFKILKILVNKKKKERLLKVDVIVGCSAITVTMRVDWGQMGRIGLYSWYKKPSTLSLVDLKMGPYMEQRLLVGAVAELFVRLAKTAYAAVSGSFR